MLTHYYQFEALDINSTTFEIKRWTGDFDKVGDILKKYARLKLTRTCTAVMKLEFENNKPILKTFKPSDPKEYWVSFLPQRNNAVIFVADEELKTFELFVAQNGASKFAIIQQLFGDGKLKAEMKDLRANAMKTSQVVNIKRKQ